MPRVVFVVPFAFETSLRFLSATLALPNVQVGLISSDPLEAFAPSVRRHVAAHHQVGDALDPRQIAGAAHELGQRMGGLDRLVGVLEQLQVPLAQAREALGLPGMGAQVANNFRDKAVMKDALRAAGVPCARHRLAHSVDEAVAFHEELGTPVVVKPPAGAGAVGTFRLDHPAQTRATLSAFAVSRAEPTLVEEFIVGEEHSFDTVCQDGEVVWHSISRYHPAPLEVLANDWIQWCVLLPRTIDGPEYDAIRAAGAEALTVLGMDTGLAHMEWFRRRDGSVAISEVGARPPGAQFTSLLSYAHDHDMYAAWSRLTVLGEFDPPPRRWSVGAAYLRGQGSGRVREIHGLHQAQQELGELVVEARLPQAGQLKANGYEGEGWVILRHEDTDVVERALRRTVELIQVELA